MLDQLLDEHRDVGRWRFAFRDQRYQLVAGLIPLSGLLVELGTQHSLSGSERLKGGHFVD